VLDEFLNTQLGRNARGDPVTRWAAADDGMHVLARLLCDAWYLELTQSR
jgi:hypothetical protein